MKRLFSFLAAGALFVFLIGCGGNGDSGSGSADQAGDQEATAPTGTATITGTVHFEGTPPEREELTTNRECQDRRESPPLSQNVVVNKNEKQTLRWVFVYVKEGLGDKSFPAPSEPVTLDQEKCMYQPHVFGAQTGQPIKITNSDPFQHNINAVAEVNRGFNFSQPTKGMESERTFREQEVMVRIKCDVHGWMEAYAGVVGHPFHGTTGEEGNYTLADLPAGDYVVEAWHEEYGTQTDSVTVKENEKASLDFTFSQKTAAAEDDSGMPVVTWVVNH